MDKQDCFGDLERIFVETFQHELIPGMLHNFANPLNGIMGRAQILKKRLEDNLRKIENQYPEVASEFSEIHKKIRSDIDSINTESERFYNMFHDVSGKFYSLSQKREESINVAGLIESELRFADYYLDFKHEVAKEVKTAPFLPEIKGIYSHISMSVWGLLRHAFKRTREEKPVKSISIDVVYDGHSIVLSFGFGGSPYSDMERDAIMSERLSQDNEMLIPHGLEELIISVALLKMMGMTIEVPSNGGHNALIIKMPC